MFLSLVQTDNISQRSIIHIRHTSDNICELGSDAVSVLKQVIGDDYDFTKEHFYAMGVADGARAEREGIHATGTYRLGNAIGALPRKILALMGR